MEAKNLYEHLVKQGHIGPKKTRIHVKKIARLVAKSLGVDSDSADPIARRLILESRREYWIECLKTVSQKDGLTLSEKLENALDNHYLRQAGNIWGNVTTIISQFNNEQVQYKLPTDKSNIALSLNGTRSITVFQFISLLMLSPHFMRHKQGESAPNLLPIWYDALGEPMIFQEKTGSLKEFLIKAIYCGLPREEWQKNILSILEAFYTQTRIYLGHTSWTTLSRGIKGSAQDYISQDDFRRFIQSDAKDFI